MPAAAPSPTPSPRRRRWSAGGWVLLAALGLFAAGIVHLFDLRFSTGEMYPVYSGFRSDPLGTKALYYSLQALPGLRVERNLRPLRYLGEEPSAVLNHRDDDPDPVGNSGPTAVLYLGANPYQWPFLMGETEVNRLEKIMERGGRAVVAFMPATAELTSKRLEKNRRDQRKDQKTKDDARKAENGGKDQAPPPKNQDKKDTPPAPTPAAGAPPATPAPPAVPDEENVYKEELTRRWHVDYMRTGDKKDDGKTEAAGTKPATVPLDGTAVPAPGTPVGLQPVSWHSTADFNLDHNGAREAGWHALYMRSQRPVIIARAFGNSGGELILVGDTYLFSNEALRKEPRSGLISALIGPCRRIIFEETHLGITEKPGLMTLARRYHLQGALAALAALAVLFLWKNMVSLVPASAPPETAGNFAPGRDSGEGFVNLLRRGVPARDLLKTCLTQWRAANALPGSRAPGAEVESRLNAIAEEEAARPVHRRSAVSAYRAMCAVLKRRGITPGP